MAPKRKRTRRTPKRVLLQTELAETARRLELEAANSVSHLRDPNPPQEKGRRGTTRAHEIQALGEKIQRIWDHWRHDSKEGPTVRFAMTTWKQMEQVTWQLAMTGKRIADLEARRLTSNQIDEEDLRQDGYIGLERAAQRFDPNQGVKFDTYARWWARAEMTRAMEQRGRTIRIPAGAAEQLRLIHRVQSEWQRKGIDFSLKDVADTLHIDEARVRRLLTTGMTISLESEVDAGNNRRPLHSVLHDDFAEDPESLATFSDQTRRLYAVINHRLDEREKRVLTRRYGLKDGTFRTFKEIGKEMGLSRERIRQIEISAFSKIKKNTLFVERTPLRHNFKAA